MSRAGSGGLIALCQLDQPGQLSASAATAAGSRRSWPSTEIVNETRLSKHVRRGAALGALQVEPVPKQRRARREHPVHAHRRLGGQCMHCALPCQSLIDSMLMLVTASLIPPSALHLQLCSPWAASGKAPPRGLAPPARTSLPQMKGAAPRARPLPRHPPPTPSSASSQLAAEFIATTSACM